MADSIFPKSPLDRFIAEAEGYEPPQIPRPQATNQPAAARPLRSNGMSAGLMPPPDLQSLFEEASAEFGVPVNVLAAMAQQESSYNPRNVNTSSMAKGLFQYMDPTASALGINPFDARQATRAAAMQLRERLDKGETLQEAIAHHHAGPNRKLWGPKTEQYVESVLGKAGEIGKGFMQNAPKAEAFDPAAIQAELDAKEPGRYKVLSPEEAERYQRRSELMQGQGQLQAAQDALKPGAPSPLTIENQQQYAPQPAPSPLTVQNQQRVEAGMSPQDTRPYQGFLEATGNALSNVPERFQQSIAGLIQMAGEDLGMERERFIADRARQYGITPGDMKLLAWAGNQSLIDPKMPIPEALQTVKQNIAQSLNDDQLKQLSAAGIVNPDEITAYAKQWRKDTKATMAEVRPEPGSMAYYGSAAIASLAEMGPMIAGAIITRSPAVAMGIMGGQVGGQAYAEGRERGLDEEQAQTYAVLTAAAEAVPEALVVGRLLKPGAGAVRKVLEGSVLEGAQEAVTAALQAGIDQQMIEPDMTLREALVRIRDGAIIGALAGGGMGAITAGADAVANRPRPAPQERIEPTIDAAPKAEPSMDGATPAAEPAATTPEAQAPTTPAAEVPEQVAPAPVNAAPPQGPLSRSAAKAAPGPRVVVAGETFDPITGELLFDRQDSVTVRTDTGELLEIPREDINAGMVAIQPEAAAVEQPPVLAGQVMPEALQEIPPQPVEQPAPSKIEAPEPRIPEEPTPRIPEQPTPRAPEPSYADMTEVELRERMKYLSGQAKANGGWNKLLTAERRKVEKAISALKAEQPAASKDTPKAEQPADQAPVKWFGTREKADAFIAKKGMAGTHEVVEASNKRFEIREKADQSPAATEMIEPVAKQAGNIADRVSGRLELNDKARTFNFFLIDPQEDNSGVQFAEPGEVGRIIGRIRGDQMQVTTAGVSDHAQGKGVGTKGYAQLADAAFSRGMELASDVEVTEAAARAYEKLSGMGYSVERNPAAKLEDVDGVRKWVAKTPVFVVRPAASQQPATPQPGQQVTLGKGRQAGTVVDVTPKGVKVQTGTRVELMSLAQFNKRLAAAEQVMDAPAPVADAPVNADQAASANPASPDIKAKALSDQEMLADAGLAGAELRNGATGGFSSSEAIQQKMREKWAVFDAEGQMISSGWMDGKQAAISDAAARKADRAQPAEQGPSESAAVNDYLAGRRDTPPTVAEVEAEQQGDKITKQIQNAKRRLRETRNRLEVESWLTKDQRAELQQQESSIEREIRELRRAAVEELPTAAESQQEAQAEQQPAAEDADRFAGNKLFTADKVAAARARLKSKMGQFNSGIDPEILIDGMTIAGAYIESGVRSFADYAQSMTEDFGPKIKPYLLSFWEGARNYPGLDTAGMTSVEESAKLHAELNRELPKEEAKALGSEVKKPAKRTKKTGDKGDTTLTQDWGVDHIDGYGESYERETGNSVKDQFMKDAAKYLGAVADTLEKAGYVAHSDAKGRPTKPVSKSEGGVAGSGDVSLTMRHPQIGTNVYVNVGESALRGVVPTTPSGIAVLYRVSSRDDDRYATRNSVNRWAPTDLSAADLAAIIMQEAGGSIPQMARPAVEAPNDTQTTEADTGADAAGAQPGRVQADESERATGSAAGKPDGRVRAERGERTAGRAEQDGRAEPEAGRPADDVRGDRGTGAQPDRGADHRNYRIAPGELTRTGSWKSTAEQNVRIVELVKQITAEGRQATPEEKAQLTKFTGWGASEIANGIFPNQYGQYKDGWRELGERLKAAMTPEEYAEARRTTQYAHYTSEPVIRSVYSALERMGFNGGQVLEPGMGVGLFNGLMPEGMAGNSQYTGIEYDTITGNIAKLLYPQSNIIVGDFTQTKLPRDFFDAAIGNPPFGQIKIQSDPEYKKQGFLLHDYFFAKTIDRVKPGGLLVFVTSKGTMDKANDRARKYLAERADLLGAIRLPQTAFKGNAGTEVVTDVIFLRKRREGEAPAGESWQGLAEVATAQGPAYVNEYFAAHPEMVLGRHAKTGSMYRADEYTVEPIEGNIEDLFAKAVQNLPEGIYRPERGSQAERAAVQRRDYDPKVKKEGGVYVADDGSLMQVEDGQGVPLTSRLGSNGKMLELKPREVEWLKGYTAVRDALKQAQYDQLNEGPWEKSLKALNKAYDDFTKKHGPILAHSVTERENEDGSVTVTRRFKNQSLIYLDAEGALAYALEEINPDGSISKAPVLKGRTLNKPATPRIATVQDAMFVSLNDTGRFDLADIARLAGKTEQEVVSELGDAIYEDPSAGWTTADEYLSGNVVRKLKEAEAAARLNKALQRNVEALKNVQPRALAPQDITVQLGSAWVPASDVKNFAAEVLGESFRVTYSPTVGQWGVDGSASRVSEWGIPQRNAAEILEAVLNNRALKITYRDSEGKTHTDTEATEKANDIAKKMRGEFKRWIWSDTARADRLAKFYNENYNNIAPRQFDGSHLTLPGVSSRFNLRPHQKRAIWRTIQQGDTYYAHAVGAGKTFTMIAAGMEERRLGLSKKPMYVVPNHMLAQFSKEFLELYPTASIMVADEQNFHTHNRRKFVAQAALNDPDAIVITHSAFGRIGMSPEYTEKFIRGQIDDWQAALEEADKQDRVTVKQIERRIEQLENRLKAIIDSKKDQVLTFEELGVDRLYVDEGHEFRKLDFPTNRGNIKGIDPSGSQRAMDLYMKVQYLREKNPNRALVMASGTPITNTMGELFTVQRYFQPAQLEEDGDDSFDMWANHYGEVVEGLEQNAAGGYETVSRFAKFVNVPELMSRVRSFMDILTSPQLGDLVQRPDVDGGGRQVVVTPVPDGYKEYQKTLEARIKAIRNRKGPPKAGEDIILNVIADGRFSAIDMRFVDPSLPSDPKSKLNVTLDEMIRVYNDTADNEYATGGQVDAVRGGSLMLFTDIGLGEQSAKSRGFDMKAWIEKRLIEGGVKPEHIAFMRDHKAHAKKERLFDDLRQGRKRILIGGKDMETGVNAQKRLVWLGHLDAPWFPASVEQREGRIIRQGNQNKRVAIQAFATKGSYDSTMWGMNARKARFIEQAMSGDTSVRSMDDVSEASAFEMAAALASGDERYMKLAGLKGDVERLSRLYSAHMDEQRRLRSEKMGAESAIKHNEEKIAAIQAVLPQRVAIKAGAFSAKVGSQTFDSREQFSEAVFARFKELAEGYTAGDQKLGELGGFPVMYRGIEMRGGSFAAELSIDVPTDPDPLAVFPVDPDMSVAGIATRAANAVNGLDAEIGRREANIAEFRSRLEKIERRLGASFPEASELAEKREALAELEQELEAESKAAEAAAAEAAAEIEANEVEQQIKGDARYSVATDWDAGQAEIDGHKGISAAWPTDDFADNGAPYSLTVYLSDDYDAGHLILEQVGDGEFSITEAVVDEPGKGTGGRLYRALADFLGARDMALLSDSELSIDSQRMYESLRRRGYSVETVNEPRAKGDGWVEADGPIYRVTAKADSVRYSIKDGVPQAEFGPVSQAASVADAVERLMADQNGEAIVPHKALGEISIVYGNGGMGLAHIAKRRGESFMRRLPDLIENGTLYTKPGQTGRVFLGNDTDEAAIRLDWNGEAKTWLISAYEKYPELQPATAPQQGNRSQVVAERTGKPMSPEDVRRKITKGMFGDLVSRMIDKGMVVIHSTSKTLPKEMGKGKRGIQAVTEPNGTVHLVANNLTPETTNGVLLHEMFHSGTEALVGSKRWGELMGMLGSLRRQAEQSTGKAGELLRRAEARVQAAKAQGAIPTRMENEEFGAYLIEEYEIQREAMPSAFRRWVEDVIGTIKAYIFSRYGKQIGQLTPQQLRALAKDALLVQGIARRGELYGPKAEWFSVNKVTETPAFKRWFGDSKVVDADGKPLVVYHGTKDDITKFDKRKSRTNKAFFFATDRGFASSPAYTGYIGGRAKGGGNVMPVYLSIKNPLVLDDLSYNPMFESGVIDEARNAGHDGIHVTKDGRWIAFEPKQIKSAIGNVGTFDPSNPDIRFSIAPEQPAPTEAEIDGWLSRKLTDAMAGPKSKGQYNILSLAPMDRMIEELVGGNAPAQEYLKLKRAMDAYRTRKHTAFDTIAQDWLKLNVKNRKAAKEMAELMHESTIAQTDPAERFKSILTERDRETINRDGPESPLYPAAIAKQARDQQRKIRHAELKARFDALPTEFQAKYRQVRDTYQAMAEELDQILIDNMSKAIDMHGRKAERTYYKELERIRDDGLTGAEKAEAEAKALKKFNTAMTKLRWNKRARMTQMRQQFESNRLEGPYFPLARFGDLFVTVRDRDTGEVISFSRFENSTDQQRFAKRMARFGVVETGLLSNSDEIRGAVDPRFVSDVESILEGAEIPDSVKDQVWQRYLESMPDLSLRKGFIHRKGRAGYSQDALRAFASRMFHGAHQMGRLKYGQDMQEQLDLARDAARAADTPERDTAVVNELERRHQYVMNPKGSALAQHLTSAAFIWQLSMSPAAALVNVSQTVMIGVPVLGAQYGMDKAGAQLLRAMKDFTKGYGRAERANLSEDEKAALRDAYETGLIESTQSHNLAGVGETGVEYSAIRNRVMGVMAWAYHQAERFNREVTFLAAYRLAKAAGMDQQAAIDEGARLTWKTHFDYGNTNRPRAMHGDAAKVALIFRNYQINMLWRLFRDAHQAINAEGPARTEAIKQLAGITGLMALSAGIRGTWLFGLGMVLASLIFGDDAEEKFKKGTVELLGPTMGGFLLNGVPGHAAGLALSERIGMPDLWFRSPDRQLEGQDEFNYWLTQLLGYLPSMAGNIHRGFSMAMDGEVFRGVETASPKFVKDLMRAARFADEGVQTLKGEPLVDRLTFGEVAAQALGFTPAVVAEQYERNNFLKNAEQRIMDERRKAMDSLALAIKLEDAEAKANAEKAIKAYNEKHPDYPITGNSIRQSLRSRAQTSARTEGGVVLNPRLNERLRGELGPALYK